MSVYFVVKDQLRKKKMDDRCNDCPHKLHCLLEENLCEDAEERCKEYQDNPFNETDEDYFDKYDEPWGDLDDDEDNGKETV